MMRGVGGERKSIHQSWLTKGLGLGWLCWGFKGVQEEIPYEEDSTFQIGSMAYPPGEYTSPQLHIFHRLFDQDGYLDSSSPSLLSRPYSLWLLLIPQVQRLSLWDNWEDDRGSDEGHWHAHTRGLPLGLPEVVWTVQEVHCSRKRLVQRRLEFHVCTINKSAHMKKVWKLIVCTSCCKNIEIRKLGFHWNQFAWSTVIFFILYFVFDATFWKSFSNILFESVYF